MGHWYCIGYFLTTVLCRERSGSGLHLGMTIRAEQDALRCLLSHLLYRPSEAASGDPELLRLRVDVVEVQRTDAPVVATKSAGSAGLGDQEQSCSGRQSITRCWRH